MAERSRGASAALKIDDLQVYYGESHALQGVSLTLEDGVLAVVGRNGMGKTTLCNTIAGLKDPRGGSIRVFGRETSRLEPHVINRLGVGYVPQGRRVWPSLSVDEHLRLSASRGDEASWTVERIYQTFPRLGERKTSGGAQLSGGEQQMLAISRALLGNPRLLIMDEPTEGLAPVIVEQVERMLVQLAEEGEMAVLVIEQNIGVATAVSDHVAIMVNGRINRVVEASVLASDRDLQQRLLGVGRQSEERAEDARHPESGGAEEALAQVYRVERGGGTGEVAGEGNMRLNRDLPNRWSMPTANLRRSLGEARRSDEPGEGSKVFAIPFAERIGRTAIVAGTFDTKGRELMFVAERLKTLGVPVRTVDLSTSGKPSRADVTPLQVASMHPRGTSEVFSGDRGRSVSAMADAFARWIGRERHVGGVISAGGSGGTSLATAGMRALPVGIPKIMVSTVAAGDVGPYVGASDIMMFHSVADVQGLNSITEQVLANAAHALAGMIAQMPSREAYEAKRKLARPAVGITMFGVTTPCVQAATKRLEKEFDCLVFHATGIGGRAMETLGHSGLLAGFLDITTTEVADMLVGGVFKADEHRFGAAIETGLPYVGSVGALDMVNFGPRATVPAKFQNRNFVVHNPNVTLMRTTRDENRAAGEWIGERLNRMDGPVRFLLPEGGVSMLDRPGQPFHDPEADAALFEAIEKTVRQTGKRRLERVKANINDERFVEVLVGAFEFDHATDQQEGLNALRTKGTGRPFPGHEGPPRADRRRRRRHGAVGQMRGRGRDRPHRHLQFRPLPNGRAGLSLGASRLWQRQRDRRRDGPRDPARGHPDARAGRRQRDRSVLPVRSLPRYPQGNGLRRHPELPDGRSDRRDVPRQSRGNGDVVRARDRSCPDGERQGHADHALCLLGGRSGRNGQGRRRYHRLPSGADDRRVDRGADGADASGLPGARRCMVGGGAEGQQGRDRTRPRRSGLRAGGCGIRAQEHQELSRLLRCLLDGAAADGTRADRADTQVQGRRPLGRQALEGGKI